MVRLIGQDRQDHAMMYLDTPPQLIGTEVFSAMPDRFRRKGVRSDWADANRPGQPTDCFIEGPAFDADGNLYIVDIPFGRIFRIAPDGQWSLVTEYDGWPNGLKIRADGRVFVADYRHGIMECEAGAGRMRKRRTERWLTRSRGLSTSSIAVPIIVRLTTTIATAMPGGTIAHHAPTLIASRANAFWISSPHDVTLGSPSPRKAMAVSAKIA